MLGLERDPRLAAREEHLCALSEVDRANKRLADDPGISQIPLDGLRQAIEHCLGDELCVARGRSCQEGLNVALHHSTERCTSPQFRRRADSKCQPGHDPQAPQNCFHIAAPTISYPGRTARDRMTVKSRFRSRSMCPCRVSREPARRGH